MIRGYATFAQVVDGRTIIYNLRCGYIPKVNLSVKVPDEASGVNSSLERTLFTYQKNTYEVKHKTVSDLDPILGIID